MRAERGRLPHITREIRLATIQGGMKVTVVVRRMRWGKSLLMHGDFMICMGMCMNGAGIGMVTTQAKINITRWAHPRGLAACFVAVTVLVRLVACVLRPGFGTPRIYRAATKVSALFVPN